MKICFLIDINLPSIPYTQREFTNSLPNVEGIHEFPLHIEKKTSKSNIFNPLRMNITELLQQYPDKVLNLAYPKAYPNGTFDPKNIKGIVLGCDPSNFSNNGKTVELETVFGISGKGQDKRYFKGVLDNLKQIGLLLENMYVQNLCQNYFYAITSENEIWEEVAKLWAVSLKKELTDLKIPENVPVFLTSEKLYHVLLKEGKEKHKAKDLYTNPTLTPIKAGDNLLGRPLIPLYRHYAYNLDKWKDYVAHIKQQIPQ